MSAAAGHRSERGFSLLESMVALAIAAAGTAAFTAANSASGGLVLRAQQRAQSLAVARDLIGSIGTDVAISPGVLSGTAADGTQWRVQIAPLQVVLVDGRADDGTGLYSIHVTVRAPGRNAVPMTVSTWRLDRVYLR